MLNTTCQGDIISLSAKQGSTFHYAGSVNLPSGVWTAYCSVVQAGTTIPFGGITVTLGTPVVGVYPISLYASPVVTGGWKVKRLDCDLVFVDSSPTPNVVPTPSFSIDVAKRITIIS